MFLIHYVMKFKVEINPFKQKATVSTKVNNQSHTVEIYYEDIDEWNSFKVNGQEFDIQFHYDAEFLVSIYPIENDRIDYSKTCEVELTFKLTD